MRGFSTQRSEYEVEQARRARARLGALRPRRGWVPRVPEAARELAMLGVQAERMDVGRDSLAELADAAAYDGRGAERGESDDPEVGSAAAVRGDSDGRDSGAETPDAAAAACARGESAVQRAQW